MICNCIHENICIYCKELFQAIDKIVPMYFPGPAPQWEEFEKAIQKTCKHRTPKEETK